jgi:ribosomal protein L16/L10AE
LLHLLKWQYQPQRRSDSWLDSITDARTQIELTLEDSPSLKSYPADQLEASYQRARRQAARQTGIEVSVFPDVCPYSLEVVLAENWLPES